MEEAFLALVRLGIGNAATEKLPDNIDWVFIEAFAKRHGLLGVLVDGVNRLPQSNRPPQVVWLRWIGEVMQGYEQRYALYRKAVADLGAWYHAHGYRMMLLKGLACGLDWPKPEHRPYGDIDIYLFGKQKEADNILSRKCDIKIDTSHHHHTVFQWQGFTVENHYDFVNVHVRKSSKEIEAFLKEIATQCSTGSPTNFHEEPPVNLHALFLIRHMVSHFASAELSLRQVLDWAFFVEKHHAEVDWEWLVTVLEKYHMIDFFNCINAVCVDDLGFEQSIFPYIQFNPFLKERVLVDILEPKYAAAEPKHLFPRLIYKYRRWQGNAWKQNLCFPENRMKVFFTSLYAHMLKPASI